MLKLVKLEYLIKKHVLCEMTYVSSKTSALSILKQMGSENLRCIGINDDSNELINIFTEFDIE